MQLFNHTKIPTEILKPVLLVACRKGGCVTLPVKVTTSINRGCYGTFHPTSAVQHWFLTSRRYKTASDRKSRWVQCPAGGYVTLNLQSPLSYDPLQWAENVYTLMVHEAKHGADHRAHRKFDHRKLRWSEKQGRLIGRRQQWKNRPEEKRAMACEKKATRGANWQEPVLNLGLWAETQNRDFQQKINHVKSVNNPVQMV